MVKIAVFDSGLGSLSIIRAMRKIPEKMEIIYFADQSSYPYGNKSRVELSQIIEKTIQLLEQRFSPDLVVVASNTPSLMLDLTRYKKRIVNVKPPLTVAKKKSQTRQIGILGTKSAVNSTGLTRYIRENNSGNAFHFTKIDGSELVELVESGKFITNKKHTKKTIKKVLDAKLLQNDIDTITLSSTHLPFLMVLLQKMYPRINFIDPAGITAKKILLKIKNNKTQKNSMRIFASGNPKTFQDKLHKLGIKNKVRYLSF